MAEVESTLSGDRRAVIRTPDQRLRVFISSTLQEVADERVAAREAIIELHLSPVMFELGARPHPPRDLYRAYLDQSHIFVGIYWQKYGWVAPDMDISGLEDEYRLSGNRPKLMYIKAPAPDREPRLKSMLDDMRNDGTVSYKPFTSAAELRQLIANDLALLLTERFETAQQDTVPGAVANATQLNNLPAQSTPLIGRDEEAAEIASLLRRPDVRLVTLCGSGGIGKTRLAIEVAQRLLPEFTDGVCFVALAAVSDPNLVNSTIAQALGLRPVGAAEGGGQASIDTLKQYLRAKQLLLVLDNFEQVTDAAPVIGELLAAAPRLDVLVTSRTLLRLTSEYEYTVPPLDVPDIERMPDINRLSQYEAVKLFIERARAAKSTFTVDNDNAPAVAEICARLDGVPLALELAAARIRLLSPQAMLARLVRDTPLKLLSGGARDLPSRQQALRTTIEWSYRLLNPQEQTLFARLGVFVGGCTLESIDAVCNADGALDSMELVSSLLDKSLIRYAAATSDDEPRFRMFDTIREFAEERLRESGEYESIAGRHTDYFAELIAQAAPMLRSREQTTWLAKLEADNGNTRAVLRRLIDAGDLARALQVAFGLWLFWLINAHLGEGVRWVSEIADRLAAANDGLQLMANGALGGLLVWTGDYERATPLLEAGAAFARMAGARAQLALVLNALAIAAINEGDSARAQSHLDESTPILRETGQPWDLATALNVGSWLATRAGDYARTEQLANESLTLTRGIGDRLNMAIALYDLGWAALQQGKLDQARKHLAETIPVCIELRYLLGLAYGLEGLAVLAVREEDYTRAATLMGAASVARERSAAPAWRADKAVLEDATRVARERLADEFAAAWEAGRRMSLDQVSDYAVAPARVS